MGHLQTLVPLGAFESEAMRLLGSKGYEDLLVQIASDPKAGAVVQGLGGMRKLRFSRPGSGKQGGTRVIYYFHDVRNPVFLFLIYAKADQEDIAPFQRKQLKKLVKTLKQELTWNNNNG